jgi:hypothetical protein
MSRGRRVTWVVNIGVFSALLYSFLVRFLPSLPLPVLALSVATVAGAACMFADISPGVGGLGGSVAPLIVAVVLWFTIAAAPVGPGARRPQLSDLLWQPLVILLLAMLACGVAGWLSVRISRKLGRRA